MANTVRISDLDFVFISFREPNREYNYANLLNIVPWAKRVDGVVGFDSAHKAAAELAETDFFISIDGDNIINEQFLLQTLDWSKTNPQAVHRWKARNSINGLIYGNGGIVGWDRNTCFGMKTHENADTEENQIDFCWGVPHENLHNVYSETVINSSAEQAYVAGFREGVKMSLDRGKPISSDNFLNMPSKNLKCLTTWMSVGADIEYGKYAMMGARVGCWLTIVREIDVTKVRELDYIVDTFNKWDNKQIDTDITLYGNSLRQRLGIPIADFKEEESKFFKFCNSNYVNKGVQDRE